MGKMQDQHDAVVAYMKKHNVTASKAIEALGYGRSGYYKYRYLNKSKEAKPKRTYTKRPKFETVVVQGSESAPKVIALVGSGIEVVKALKELL